MTIALLGCDGMLGRDILWQLSGEWTVVPFNRFQLDITSENAIDAALSTVENLTTVINCAAYTNVDGAESEPELAFLINGEGPGHLARWCRHHKCTLIHFSTDYVFNGSGTQPYTELDLPDPINRYGESKLAGEVAILNETEQFYILRVQWLYGTHGKNFVKTMKTLLETRSEVSVVSDQIGAPTWTIDIANAIASLLKDPIAYGIYHATPSDPISWCDVTIAIKNYLQRDTTIHSITSDQMPRPARRPLNSRLNCSKLTQAGGPSFPHWHQSLTQFLSNQSN